MAHQAQQASPSLTEAVRALYEETVTPVAQIARLAGVSECTLYKHVARGRWRRRYPLRGAAAGEANRGRKRDPRPPQRRGSGGRFVTPEEAAQPQPSGLKALDPHGAVQAAVACQETGAQACQALAGAKASAEFGSAVRTLAHLVWALRQASVLAGRGDPVADARKHEAAKKRAATWAAKRAAKRAAKPQRKYGHEWGRD